MAQSIVRLPTKGSGPFSGARLPARVPGLHLAMPVVATEAMLRATNVTGASTTTSSRSMITTRPVLKVILEVGRWRGSVVRGRCHLLTFGVHKSGQEAQDMCGQDRMEPRVIGIRDKAVRARTWCRRRTRTSSRPMLTAASATSRTAIRRERVFRADGELSDRCHLESE